MNRFTSFVGLMLGVAVAVLGAGCDGTECGEGTREVDGACIPTSDLCGPNTSYDEDTGQCVATSSCAQGTTEQDGECVPDGSVVCETGTTFDPDTGSCVADITGCAAGTVLLGGECVPEDDLLSADIEEGAEPNDTSDDGGSIPVPAEGNDITVHGCITPYVDADEDGELDADMDAFTLEVSGPTLLEITVDGVGGLAGAFQLTSEVEAVAADGWTRFGINLVGDVSQRQVFLPGAGRYVIQFADSRSLFLGAPAGGDGTCYYATIQTLTIPAASPITTDASGDFEEVRFFRYDPTSDGEILSGLLLEDSSSAVGGLVQLVGNEYRVSASADPSSEIAGGGLRDDDDVLIVVDAMYDFALEPVDFELLLEAFEATPLQNGDPTTVTNDANGNLLWFDVTAGEVVSFAFTAADPLAVEFYSPSLRYLGTLCSEGSPCTAESGVLQIRESGLHYAVVVNTGGVADGQAFDLTASWMGEAPTPLAVDAPLMDVALSDDGVDWYELTIQDMAWLLFSGAPVSFATLELDAFDRSVAGLLGDEVPTEGSLAFDGSGAEFGRIFDLPEVAEVTYLVRLRDPAFDGTADDEVYDFSVAARPYAEIDLVAADTHTEADTALGADAANHYLIVGPSERFLVDVTDVTGSDVAIELLDADENVLATADGSGAAGGESLGAFNTPGGWIAFAVTEGAGVAGDYDLSATIDMPDYVETVSVGQQLPGDGTALQATVSVAGTCTLEAAAVTVSSTSERWDVDFDVTSPAGTTAALTASEFEPTVIDGTFPTDLAPTDSLAVLAGEDGIGDWSFDLLHTFPWSVPGVVNSVGVELYCE